MSAESPTQVLVAEDNVLNQRIIAHVLRGLGCDVELVETGVQAVAALTQKHYDLVLMDVRMPEMDGLEATRQVRRMLPADAQPRIYALTAGTSQEERDECVDAGMDGFLAKPIQREQLAELCAQAGARRAGE